MADEEATEFTDANIPLFTIGELDADTGKGDGTTEEPDFTPPGSEGSDDALVLDAPTLISPPDGYQAGQDDTIRFRWQGVDNAQQYVIQFSASFDFKAVATSQENTTSTYIDKADFSRDIIYYWRVMAINVGTGTYSPWSDVWSFSVGTPQEPTPDPDIDPIINDPDIDDQDPDQFDNPLVIIRITATPNPVEINGACALDVEVESDYGGVEYVWSIPTGDGSLANSTTKTPTYTASAHRDVVGIQVVVTDDQGNTDSTVAVVFVDNTWSSIIATDGIQIGCTVDVSTVDPSALSAPGWGADGTDSNPGGGNFPTHGSRYSNGCELESDLGVLIFNEGKQSDWFRYYVSGYKMKLLYPMSKKSGIMKVTINRYDPRVDSDQTVGTFYIDQSADVVDVNNNDCWELGIKEIQLGLIGTTTDNDEWDYDSSDGSLDRYIYRLNFEMSNPVGSNTDEATYSNTFVGLIGIFVYREERDVIFVDTNAQWNAGTVGNCTVANDQLSGDEETALGDSDLHEPGWGFVGKVDVSGDNREAAWPIYIQDSYGDLAGLSLDWGAPDHLAHQAMYNVFAFGPAGWIHYSAITKFRLPIPAGLGQSGVAIVRFWFEKVLVNDDRITTTDLDIRLYQFTWAAGSTPSGTVAFQGSLKNTQSYDGATYSLNGGPNNEDYYVDFRVNVADLQSEKDGSNNWYGYVIFDFTKIVSWLLLLTFPVGGEEMVKIELSSNANSFALLGPDEYTSAIFNFAYIYDFVDQINWSQNNRYFNENHPVGGLIEWRAGMQADLSDGTWGSLHEAFEGRKIQYAQFRITFRVDGHIHRLYLLIKEGRPR